MYKYFKAADFIPVPPRLTPNIKLGKEDVGVMSLSQFLYTVKGLDGEEHCVGVMRVRKYAHSSVSNNPWMVFHMTRTDGCQICSNREVRICVH